MEAFAKRDEPPRTKMTKAFGNYPTSLTDAVLFVLNLFPFLFGEAYFVLASFVVLSLAHSDGSQYFVLG